MRAAALLLLASLLAGCAGAAARPYHGLGLEYGGPTMYEWLARSPL